MVRLSSPRAGTSIRDFLQLELDRLFPQVWQAACREEEIPDPGCYYEYSIGRQSIMVMRQRDGSIKAFYNTCAHRGMKIVRGAGCASHGDLRCEFHGWRYGLDGRSSFVPCRDEFAPRPREQWGLTPVKVGTWGGWVFITMADDPPNLLEWLEPLPTALEPFRLQDMRYRWRKRTFLAANYKTVIDAFIEDTTRQAPIRRPCGRRRDRDRRRNRRSHRNTSMPLHADHHLRKPLTLRLYPATRHCRPRQRPSAAGGSA